MKYILVFVFCLYGGVSFALNLQVVDGSNHPVVLKKPAQRIITLAPNLAEMVSVIGAEKKIVGVSAWSNFPSTIKKLPITATYNHLDLERIVSLHPDLVVAWREGNSEIGLNRIKALKIPVYEASFNHIHDVAKVMVDLGILTGQKHFARQRAKTFLNKIATLKRKYFHKKIVTVFYQISKFPLITLNNQTLVGGIIHLCGGKNIFGEVKNISPIINITTVLERNPQVILISSQMSQQENVFAQWKQYLSLQAVKKQQLYVVNANWAERYGPRITLGVNQICRDIDLARLK